MIFLEKSFTSDFHKKILEFFYFLLTFSRIYSLKLFFLSEIFLERHMRIVKVFDKKFLKKINKKIFIDIGAGTGFYSIYFAMKNFFVISVEPEKNNFNTINKMIKIFKLENSVLPVNVAVSNKNSYAYLYSWIKFSGISTTTIKPNGWKKEFVKTYTFDKLIRKLHLNPEEIKVVKIDVEGAEYSIISRMKKSILKNIPLIVFECSDIKKMNKIIEKIENVDFKVKWRCGINDFVCINKRIFI